MTGLALIAAFASDAQDEGYPEGTLAPTVDLGLQPVALTVPAKYRDHVPENLSMQLPPGFSASVYAAGLRKPRLMAFSPAGVLHVCNMGANEILALPDEDGDGVADEHIVVLDGLREAHSMAFYKGDMYVAEEHQVIRGIDADGDGIYEDREVFPTFRGREATTPAPSYSTSSTGPATCRSALPATCAAWISASRSGAGRALRCLSIRSAAPCSGSTTTAPGDACSPPASATSSAWPCIR
jgi:hypothetical protein